MFILHYTYSNISFKRITHEASTTIQNLKWCYIYYDDINRFKINTTRKFLCF